MVSRIKLPCLALVMGEETLGLREVECLRLGSEFRLRASDFKDLGSRSSGIWR